MDYKNLDLILDKYAKLVVNQAKKNLVDERKSLGNLYKTLNYEVIKESNLFLVDFLMEDYGVFVDKGVKGKTSTYPETTASLSKFQYGSGTGKKGGLTDGVNGWLKKKRFQWKDDKGKFMSYESMTYIISRSIYNKGIKATTFFTKPFESGLKTLPNELLESFALDIEKAIILGTKK